MTEITGSGFGAALNIRIVERLPFMLLLFLCFLQLGFGMRAYGAEANSRALSSEELIRQYTEDAEELAYLERIKAAYDEGVRLFDDAKLLSPEEQQETEAALQKVIEESGLDAAIVTVNGMYGREAEDFADLIYVACGFGRGETKDGSLLLIDMEERYLHIYTKGLAVRYLTDSALDRMIEEIGAALGEENYREAFLTYPVGVSYFYEAGIAADQYNYDTVTGNADYYYPEEKKGLSLWEILLSLALAAGIAVLPCGNVRKKYAMEAEKQMAAGFQLAYRSEAKLLFDNDDTEAKLLNRFVTTMPLPRVRATGNIRSGGSFRGGGRSTMRMGRGGMRGGRSGRF